MPNLRCELIAWLGKSLSLKSLEVLGRAIGLGIWSLLPGRRRLATDNVIRHLDLARPKAEEVAKDSFKASGQAFTEIFSGRRADWRWYTTRVRLAYPEEVARVVNDDRPIVATTGHFGAWELMAPVMGFLFPRQNKQIVIRHDRNQDMFALLQRLRRRFGIEVLGHRQASGPVLHSLRQNGVAAFLVDHNTTQKDAFFLPFLGQLAAVNMGPALLALRTKALVWPVFLRREGGGYVFDSDQPLDTTKLTGSRQAKKEQVISFYSQAIERRVRACPRQWFWMHNRWKTRPRTEGQHNWQQSGARDGHQGREALFELRPGS